MEDKYLSIITNFGCHYTCPYCIVKNNDLHIPKTTVQGLENVLSAYEEHGCNIISLSGGGDPLWQWWNHPEWFELLFYYFPWIRIELHTSLLDMETPFLHRFYRIVYHCHDAIDILAIKRSHPKQKIRVVFVVTPDYTEQRIDKIYKLFKDSPEKIDELSFRQMVDDHYQATDTCQEYLLKYHKDRWWYIEQNDYNLYYAENCVYHEYAKIGKDEDHQEDHVGVKRGRWLFTDKGYLQKCSVCGKIEGNYDHDSHDIMCPHCGSIMEFWKQVLT